MVGFYPSQSQTLWGCWGLKVLSLLVTPPHTHTLCASVVDVGTKGHGQACWTRWTLLRKNWFPAESALE